MYYLSRGIRSMHGLAMCEEHVRLRMRGSKHKTRWSRVEICGRVMTGILFVLEQINLLLTEMYQHAVCSR
jgi:hypothetical protein